MENSYELSLLPVWPFSPMYFSHHVTHMFLVEASQPWCASGNEVRHQQLLGLCSATCVWNYFLKNKHSSCSLTPSLAHLFVNMIFFFNLSNTDLPFEWPQHPLPPHPSSPKTQQLSRHKVAVIDSHAQMLNIYNPFEIRCFGHKFKDTKSWKWW